MGAKNYLLGQKIIWNFFSLIETILHAQRDKKKKRKKEK